MIVRCTFLIFEKLQLWIDGYNMNYDVENSIGRKFYFLCSRTFLSKLRVLGKAGLGSKGNRQKSNMARNLSRLQFGSPNRE